MKIVSGAGTHRLDHPNNPQKELGQSRDVRADAEGHKAKQHMCCLGVGMHGVGMMAARSHQQFWRRCLLDGR